MTSRPRRAIPFDDSLAWEGGCLVYVRARDRDGYGWYWHEGRNVKAHRYAWERTNGPIPAGMLVCHACDNPPCCLPEHLFLGTNDENMADMVAKGRSATGTRNSTHVYPERLARGERHGRSTRPERTARGARNGQAVFTADQAAEIRRQHANRTRSIRSIAAQYGVHDNTISRLVNGRTYAESANPGAIVGVLVAVLMLFALRSA